MGFTIPAILFIGEEPMKHSKLKLLSTLEWYLLIMVPVFGTVVFSIIPLFLTFANSLQNMAENFVGLVNYELLFANSEFQQAFGNTIYMGILGILMNIPLAFVLATMLNNVNRGKSFYKICFLLPLIMSMVTVALLFKFIFSADPNSIANSVLRFFGAAPRGFFNDPTMSRETVVFMAVWKGIGYNVILFFAGLQTLPREYYEAAQIDGANEFKQWFYITIPCMRNIFIFVYITTAINVLRRFTDVFTVGGEPGAPAGSMFTIMMFIYRNSFSTRWSRDLGAGSAASVVLFFLIITITMINVYLTEGDGVKNFLSRFRIKRSN